MARQTIRGATRGLLFGALLWAAMACGFGAPAPATPAVVPTVSLSMPPTPVPRPSPAPSPSPSPAPLGELHTIGPGDSLITLAERYYGDAALWRRIYEANRDAIGNNPDNVRLGSQIRIPPKQ